MAVKFNKGGALALLDLTPMIDMVFNLLIFFMVVSQFAKEDRDFKVDLPSASDSLPLTQAPKEIFINIDRDGRYFVRSQRLSERELAEQLKKSATDNPANQGVIVRADKHAPWDAVATALRLCKQTGITHFKPAFEDQ